METVTDPVVLCINWSCGWVLMLLFRDCLPWKWQESLVLCLWNMTVYGLRFTWYICCRKWLCKSRMLVCNCYLYLFTVQAKRKPLSFQHEVFNNLLLWSLDPLFENNENTMTNRWDQPPENWDKLLQSCESLERFLEFKNTSRQLDAETGVLAINNVSVDCFGALENIGEGNLSTMDQYFVPLSLIERWGSAMGILVIFASFKILSTSHIPLFLFYILFV